ncbi:MAG: DUF6121 family protein [Lacisediminihabitans sp.]
MRWQQTQASEPPGAPIQDASPLSRALLAAIMASVLFGALLGAVYGFISLLTGRDVITEQDVGPLIGPIMAASACAVVFVSVLFSLRPSGGPLRLPWSRSVITAVAVYLLGPAIGAILVAIHRADMFSALFFFAESVTGPFVVASALISLPVVLLAPLLATSTNRPR